MSKLIVFDVDGTFLNSQAQYDKAALEYSRENDLPAPNLKSIRHGYGDPDKHDFGWGVSKPEQHRHMIAICNLMDGRSMSRDPEHTPALYDGAADGLQHLKDAGYTLAIITSKPEAPLLHLLDFHGVRGLFSSHRSYDDIARRGEREKPQPDMLRSTMKDLGFTPADTVMIGDTTMDIRMGRGAETHTIGVTWGAHPIEHLVDAGAHHIVDTAFHDLKHAIAKIFG